MNMGAGMTDQAPTDVLRTLAADKSQDVRMSVGGSLDRRRRVIPLELPGAPGT